MSARAVVQQYMDRHAMTVGDLAEKINCTRRDIYHPTDEVEAAVRKLMKNDVPFSDAIVV